MSGEKKPMPQKFPLPVLTKSKICQFTTNEKGNAVISREAVDITPENIQSNIRFIQDNNAFSDMFNGNFLGEVRRGYDGSLRKGDAIGEVERGKDGFEHVKAWLKTRTKGQEAEIDKLSDETLINFFSAYHQNAMSETALSAHNSWNGLGDANDVIVGNKMDFVIKNKDTHQISTAANSNQKITVKNDSITMEYTRTSNESYKLVQPNMNTESFENETHFKLTASKNDVVNHSSLDAQTIKTFMAICTHNGQSVDFNTLNIDSINPQWHDILKQPPEVREQICGILEKDAVSFETISQAVKNNQLPALETCVKAKVNPKTIAQAAHKGQLNQIAKKIDDNRKTANIGTGVIMGTALIASIGIAALALGPLGIAVAIGLAVAILIVGITVSSGIQAFARDTQHIQKSLDITTNHSQSQTLTSSFKTPLLSNEDLKTDQKTMNHKTSNAGNEESPQEISDNERTGIRP